MTIKKASARLKELTAERDALVLEHQIENLRKAKMKYDAVDTNNKRLRKRPKAETGKDGEESILPLRDRILAINMIRDLQRNTSAGKSIITQILANVVGTKPKLQMNTSDPEFNSEVNSFFNSIWSRNCDGINYFHFSTLCQVLIATWIREGDVLVIFDDIYEDDGKLLFYEADQLTQLSEADWKALTALTEYAQYTEQKKGANGKIEVVPMRQANGIITDRRGRTKGYIYTTAARGQTETKKEEVSIVPSTSARLIYNPFRFNQKRGVSEMLGVAGDILDISDMKTSELQTAKRASKIGIVVMKKDSTETAMLRSGVAPESVLSASTGDEQSEPASDSNYEALEALSGGFTEYVEPGEDVKVLDHNRPSVAVSEFYKDTHRTSGAGLGLANVYSTLQAQTSYTAFRGEMIITWRTFEMMQKFLERYFCDWILGLLIPWAKRKKLIKSKLPENFQYSASWSFPQMPSISPVDETTANTAQLKNGLIGFDNLLGADWKEILKARAEQLAYAKELGIPLSAFETVAGAAVSSAKVEK